MLILTGITGEGSSARIWDSKDGVTEQVDFISIAKQVSSGSLKVYGLRPYMASEVYPPDAVPVPALGIVVIPSEGSTALRQVQKPGE